MTEIDVDLALYAIGRAVEDLLVAARDLEVGAYVRTNEKRLLADVARLADGLGRPRRPPRRLRAVLGSKPARPRRRGVPREAAE